MSRRQKDNLPAGKRASETNGARPAENTRERLETLAAVIEELRAAQEELAAARHDAEVYRERYQNLFELAPDGYLVTKPRGQIIEANHTTANLYQVPARFLIGKPMSLYLAREDRAILHRAIDSLKSVDRIESTLRLQPRLGEELPVHFLGAAVRRWGGEIESIHWSLRDVTAQLKAQEELRARTQDIRDMASKLALVEEQERRRIAGEIHDHISQSLAVANLRLGLIRETLPQKPAAEIDQVRELLTKALTQTRSLTFELSPAVLYELGLGAAIEWLIEQRSNYGVHFELIDRLKKPHLPRDISVTLFQAVRELLTNIVKHARAKQAWVEISHDEDDDIVIEIQDDGVGFDPAVELSRFAGQKSMGLFNIVERLEHLGGKVQIRSAPRRGTRIRLRAPLTVGESNSKNGDNHAYTRADRR